MLVLEDFKVLLDMSIMVVDKLLHGLHLNCEV